MTYHETRLFDVAVRAVLEEQPKDLKMQAVKTSATFGKPMC
jgi:hypothetical protein